MDNGSVKREESIQGFLETIRKEGLERAEAEAGGILDKARQEAEGILEDARQEAGRKIEEAEERISRLENAFRQSMVSAAATAVRAVRSEVVEMAERLLKDNARQALNPEMMASMIEQILGAWTPGTEGAGVEVLVSENDLEMLKNALKDSLSESLASGVVLKPVQDINAGFRIGLGEDGVHYDFTDETIAEILAEYLSPAIAVFLKTGTEQTGSERENEPDR